ncbi:hypothetical protein [Ramlibacter alkalitolerans]|uniref:hypothetical protein n=1 Tax=Ramlibacter alkalitolerans TaxID=2039631 RepID=UPI002ED6BA50
MQDVVQAIRSVSDLMAEISAASTEQSAGVAQVGAAVHQMDHATQQNAALVEESAAAAASLQGQARQLVDAVAVFRTSDSEVPLPAAPQPATPPAAPAANAPTLHRGGLQLANPRRARPAPSLRTGTDDGEWQTF